MVKQKIIAQLDSSITCQITVALLIILVMKWQVLNQPPVWDTAFSIFPAAVTLAETEFDLLNLLKMPGYFEGGPNVHADSIITVITAVVISLFGKSNILFPVLHIMHFIIAAIGLVYFYRFSIPIIERKVSFLITLTILVFPVFLTQTGYLYLEIPTFTFSILCLSACAKGNYGRTIIFATLATLSKGSGIIAAATVAMAAFLEPISIKQRLIRSLSIFTLPALLIATSSLTINPQMNTIEQDFESLFDRIVYLTILFRAYDVKRYLFNTPDLLIIIFLFIALIPFSFRTFWRGLTDANILYSHKSTSIAQKHVSLSALFLVCFFGFYYIAYPLARTSTSATPVLIRYYVPAIPFLFLTISWFWFEKLKLNKRVLSALLILSSVFFCLNKYGSFYPNEVDKFGNDFSIAERSAAYTDLLSVQQESIRFIGKIARTHPVFYGLPIHYLTKYPLMHYSSAPLTRGQCIILDDRYLNAKLENFPCCFYMLRISPWLGGRIMQDLFGKALLSPDYAAVHVKSFSKGNYNSEILRINRRGQPCALPDELLPIQGSDDD
jgi:hypothetical protein